MFSDNPIHFPLLRCPAVSLPTVRLRHLPTTATRSGRFLRHRRRSHRSPLGRLGSPRTVRKVLGDSLHTFSSVRKYESLPLPYEHGGKDIPCRRDFYSFPMVFVRSCMSSRSDMMELLTKKPRGVKCQRPSKVFSAKPASMHFSRDFSSGAKGSRCCRS